MHSSVYRSVAYMAMSRTPLLQTVTGFQGAPMDWLTFIQKDLDPETPAGIRGEGQVLDLIKKRTNPRRPQE